jgi:1,4-alpha-glucan branching enzyme
VTTRTIEFQYLTGIRRSFLRNARLRGSWDGAGRYSDLWTEQPMREVVGEDGCPAFTATVDLELADAARTFRWGVVVDAGSGSNQWGIATEIADPASTDRYRELRLLPPGCTQVERYHLTWCRRLGAQKLHPGPGGTPGLRFRLWAPSAQKVEVVFGSPQSGYIHDDGRGIDETRPPVPMARGEDGVWESAVLPDFAAHRRLPYMYRVVTTQGATVFRTDVWSREQIGRGNVNPITQPWDGRPETLDGTKSCSLVVDPDLAAADHGGGGPDQPVEEFWASERAGNALPEHVGDLVIYELHVGSLGFGKEGPGNLDDAIAFLDHLVALGVNAVEILPMAEYTGDVGWGYGDSHPLCIESSAGGPDHYRCFVRECHRRGIAVIQDVVYNHFDPDVLRAEWQLDSSAPESNAYYWYEGRSGHYRSPDGGYLDNGSSGWTPRYREEAVRQLFASSAAFLVEEMHVDGLRVDLTQAMHRDNVLHATGRPVPEANLCGQKLLREWSRTLKMIRPSVFLIAEDHTGWPAVTRPVAEGGLGFDATWHADFYHHLIGDSDMAAGKARLLHQAGKGGDQPLAMGMFAGALAGTRAARIVYHESHDEAGNSPDTGRTVVTAVGSAPLVGATRELAEARARVVFGLSLLSAGTPMFFMGEEIAAQKRYGHDDFLRNREDILAERAGPGARMFRFYQDLIRLGRRLPSIRTRSLDVLHACDPTRVLAFKRWSGDEQVIVVASFANAPFLQGYRIARDGIAIPDGLWQEVLNSDAAAYGGANVGNGGATVRSLGGAFELVLPARGLLVLVRT